MASLIYKANSRTVRTASNTEKKYYLGVAGTEQLWCTAFSQHLGDRGISISVSSRQPGLQIELLLSSRSDFMGFGPVH